MLPAWEDEPGERPHDEAEITEVDGAAVAPAVVNDPWVVRRLPALVHDAGLRDPRFRSHGYVQVPAPDSMLRIADRGAEPSPARASGSR